MALDVSSSFFFLYIFRYLFVYIYIYYKCSGIACAFHLYFFQYFSDFPRVYLHRKGYNTLYWKKKIIIYSGTYYYCYKCLIDTRNVGKKIKIKKMRKVENEKETESSRRKDALIPLGWSCYSTELVTLYLSAQSSNAVGYFFFFIIFFNFVDKKYK